nr:hypothetical protein [Tanacetum cinerariifolium]
MEQSLNFMDTDHIRKKRKKRMKKRRKKRKKRVRKERIERGVRNKVNSESSSYAASDNEVESDLESTSRNEPKCKEIEDNYKSGVRPKPDSS